MLDCAEEAVGNEEPKFFFTFLVQFIENAGVFVYLCAI
jgi:hypothetical protein